MAIDSASTPAKKESGYFEENCGDLSDVIFSNYNHYGALLSVDTAGILIVNESRRSDHWEESRQGSSFSSGLVEDINDLDVNDFDEAKNDVVKDPREAKRDVTGGSEAVVYGREGSKELAYTHEDSEDAKAALYVQEDSKAVVYIHESAEIIDCTEEDSNVECAMSPSIIVEDWNDEKISNTGKTTTPVDDNDSNSSAIAGLL